MHWRRPSSSWAGEDGHRQCLAAHHFKPRRLSRSIAKLFSHVIVPRAVVREIMAGPANDPAIGAISGADWLALIGWR